ncbi:RHS repeat-associated core domain-containing protein [Pseudomonas asiatica]|uniref:RHS repeat-associated core domain-containing protein n=1 Tax=Pseudomonas asiatica TaxID=2219225 RepID=UPI0037C916ED
MATYLLNVDRQQSVLGTHPGGPRAYAPYGVMSAACAPGLAFCGEYRDPVTGNYPLGNGHRTYTPSLMRFQSPDTRSPFDEGGLNAYVYCLGEPVNHHDPTGQKAEDYVLPVLSILTNLLAVFISALRFRAFVKQVGVSRRSAVEGLSSSIMPPTRQDWALSSVSAVAGVAGLTIGFVRTADPENNWQTWALAALTVVSLATTGYEAWGQAREKPWQPGTPVRVRRREPSRNTDVIPSATGIRQGQETPF